jgi:ATP/maltotriose-dependent transcriptional regulator MalT
MLQELEPNNLFLTALEDETRAYCYYHLFVDVLLYRLTEKSSTTLPALHLAASKWCKNEGLITEAVNHALAAQDWERVSRLVESCQLINN